ncbi:4596_t:CDS:2, partial [Funneliformis geosporum]
WSSSIPNYNPQEIVDNLKRLINNEETVKMHPWNQSLKDSLEEGLEKRFMMSSPIGTSNLVCFDGAKVVFENMILPKKFQRNFTHTGSITIIRGSLAHYEARQIFQLVILIQHLLLDTTNWVRIRLTVQFRF